MDILKRFSSILLLKLLLITSTPEVHCNSEQDSYTFPESVKLKDGDEFEYIVVGAGAAGAAAASRLALAGADVLLVEAGGDPTELSKIPSLAPVLLGSSIDYQYETISNNMSCLAYRNRACRQSRGKCLGGSTTINIMIYTRGNPKDFDDFNVTGWAWADVKPYLLRYEGLQDLHLLPPSSISFHNVSGNMKMEFFSNPENPWRSRFIEAMMSLNFPFNPDVNAESQIGVTQIVGYVYDGERMGTARGYLAREDVKRKLKVAKYTKCTAVIIDDDNVARGITVVVGSGLLQSKVSLYATKEVILSAGTIATPQILMLSGIGPAEHLRDMNIPVRVDLSVGDDMIDHIGAALFLKVEDSARNLSDWIFAAIKAGRSVVKFLKDRDGPITSIGLTDICAFLNTNCYDFDNHQLMNNSAECSVPTIQYVVYQYVYRYQFLIGGQSARHAINFDDNIFKQLTAINGHYPLVVILPVLLYPLSRGTVRLASRDPLAAPAIFPNYLSDELDMEEAVKSIRIMEHLIETPLFQKHNVSLIQLELPGCPEREADSEGYWRCYARHLTQSICHSTGTSALGRVVDERLRVLGVRRLRVADVGVLPRPTRGNTASAAIAVGERLADFVMEDHQC